MIDRLSPSARDLVGATLAAARLAPRDRAAVGAELEQHFLDGLDAGVPLAELIGTFGDPASTAALIRRAKRRCRPLIPAGVGGAAVLAAVGYALAVLRLHTAPIAGSAPALEAEARDVAERVAFAQSTLDSPGGVREGFDAAAALRSRHTLWSETASLILLDRAMSAADSILAPAERDGLRDSLRILEQRESLVPRRQIISAALPALIGRLYGTNGRIDADGLRLLQRTKGVTRPSYWALLLEPFYFARVLSRAELRQEVDRLVTTRVSRAEDAGRRLAARTRP
jgi:hypothetical protein